MRQEGDAKTGRSQYSEDDGVEGLKESRWTTPGEEGIGVPDIRDAW